MQSNSSKPSNSPVFTLQVVIRALETNLSMNIFEEKVLNWDMQFYQE